MNRDAFASLAFLSVSLLTITVAAMLGELISTPAVRAAPPPQYTYSIVTGSISQFTHDGGTTAPVTVAVGISGANTPTYPVTNTRGWDTRTLPIGWILTPSPDAPYAWSDATSTATSSLTITIPAGTAAGTYSFIVKLFPGRDSAGKVVGSGSGISFSIAIDNTPPVIDPPIIIGTNGNNGWYTSDVSVSWSVSDPESGIQSASECITQVTIDTTSNTLTCTATNGAGLSSSDSVTLKRDATLPIVSANPDRPPDQSGWYNQAVSVAFIGNDGTSGIASCDPTVTYSGPDSTAASISGACTDAAGNMGAATLALRYDTTLPRVNIMTPVDGTNYAMGQTVPANYNCTDNLSGLSSCVASVPNGGNIDTSRPGFMSFNVTARDQAGNLITRTVIYNVQQSAATPTLSPYFTGSTLALSVCLVAYLARRSYRRHLSSERSKPVSREIVVKWSEKQSNCAEQIKSYNLTLNPQRS